MNRFPMLRRPLWAGCLLSLFSRPLFESGFQKNLEHF